MRITFDGSSDGTFRSRLEREVSEELTRLQVTFAYERPVELAGGQRVHYLPDFTIDAAPDHLELPLWVECKPQQMLYAVRDALGVTRRAGEYFKTDVTVEDVKATDLLRMEFAELAKPKILAELTGESVLVLGAVQGTSSLSLLMEPDGIRFSRSHPVVNQRGVQKAQEREERDERYRAQAAQWQREWQERQAKALEERKTTIRQIVTLYPSQPPRFFSSCFGCGQVGQDGLIYRVLVSGNTRWVRVCDVCRFDA